MPLLPPGGLRDSRELLSSFPPSLLSLPEVRLSSPFFVHFPQPILCNAASLGPFPSFPVSTSQAPPGQNSIQ